MYDLGHDKLSNNKIFHNQFKKISEKKNSEWTHNIIRLSLFFADLQPQDNKKDILYNIK